MANLDNDQYDAFYLLPDEVRRELERRNIAISGTDRQRSAKLNQALTQEKLGILERPAEMREDVGDLEIIRKRIGHLFDQCRNQRLELTDRRLIINRLSYYITWINQISSLDVQVIEHMNMMKNQIRSFVSQLGKNDKIKYLDNVVNIPPHFRNNQQSETVECETEIGGQSTEPRNGQSLAVGTQLPPIGSERDNRTVFTNRDSGVGQDFTNTPHTTREQEQRTIQQLLQTMETLDERIVTLNRHRQSLANLNRNLNQTTNRQSETTPGAFARSCYRTSTMAESAFDNNQHDQSTTNLINRLRETVSFLEETQQEERSFVEQVMQNQHTVQEAARPGGNLQVQPQVDTEFEQGTTQESQQATQHPQHLNISVPSHWLIEGDRDTRPLTLNNVDYERPRIPRIQPEIPQNQRDNYNTEARWRAGLPQTTQQNQQNGIGRSGHGTPNIPTHTPEFRDNFIEEQHWIRNGSQNIPQQQNRSNNDDRWEPEVRPERENSRNRNNEENSIADDDVNQRRNERQTIGVRTPIPINQWRISYGGETLQNKYDLPLHEFLRLVRLYQRSDRISDNELLRTVSHLLNGQARKWYLNNYERIRSWNEFEQEIRREFLPFGHNYALLSEIHKYRQMVDQPIGAYLTEIESKFSALSMDIPEQQKVYIIQKNLQPAYAAAVATADVQSIIELKHVCKRIDSIQTSFERNPRRPPQNQKGRGQFTSKPKNQIFTVEETEKSDGEGEVNSESEEEPEVFFVKREINQAKRTQTMQTDKNKRKEEQSDKSKSAVNRICFSCDKSGHIWKDCPEPREKIFCYRCGNKGIRSFECTRCQGNPSNPSQEARGSNETN